MLEIKDLHVNIGDVEVLRGINLTIDAGETFILFGPNGSGKTTLLMTLMGFNNYKVTSGKIIFKGEDITDAPMYDRARMGMGMSFQRPPTIHGLKTRHLVEMCGQGRKVPVDDLAAQVNFDRFLERDVNAGFSGGEIKRSELLQLMAQQPDLVLFDEPESGVDLENMVLIGQTARKLLDGSVQPASCSGAALFSNKESMKSLKAKCSTAGLIITHTGYILQYVNADRGQVMFNGQLCCEARPLDILDHVRQYGYKECMRCFSNDNTCSPLPDMTSKK
ncbi:ABC transporter ATP-binding protein [Desulfovibrio litoralis]|uniref:Iron-regulated ABC transporter ATPase subunit SufC n=1 Tax=Desulfovibrio litoralis DSM 11393 TaxID=1121455 RepID=A0A1M7RU86_9BACT|nr:ABC transporter ATP-binding protein [Desulfovibrio litoralis]SHN49770.1 Iron-regulated ABC transporter ATPase subunit SufC [Desulfovibrio litoralis DSM 11393]